MKPRDIRYVVSSLPMQAGSVPAPSPVPGVTPFAALEGVPNSINVNVAAAAQVRNPGTALATWSIAPLSGLTITPSSGAIAPGATQAITLLASNAGTYNLVMSVVGGFATGSPATVNASGVAPPPPPAPALVLSALGGLSVQTGTQLSFGVVLANPGTLPLVGTPENVAGTAVFSPATVTWSLGDLNKAFAATWAAAGAKTIRVTAPGGLVSNTLDITVTSPPPPPPPAPTLATLSGSNAANVGVAHVDTVTLDVAADQDYTVTWSRSDGATGPATSTILQGQTAASGSSTWTAAGAGRTVDFTISPALTRAGRPLAVTVSAAQLAFAPLSSVPYGLASAGGTITNTGSTASGPWSLNVPAGWTISPNSGASIAVGATVNLTITATRGAQNLTLTCSGATITGATQSVTGIDSIIRAPAAGVSNKMAITGDSLNEHFFLDCWTYWANGRIGAPLDIVANSAVSGRSISDVAAQLANSYKDPGGHPGFAGLPPLGWASMPAIGTNGWRGAGTATSVDSGTQADFLSCIAQMKTYGAHVIIGPILPVVGVNNLDAPWRVMAAYQRAACAADTSGLVHFLDATSVLLDGSGNANPAYFRVDGYHLNELGSYVLGVAWSSLLAQLFVNQGYASAPLVTDAADVYPTTAQWCTNPTNTGGNPPTGTSVGQYGTGFTFSSSIVSAAGGDSNTTPWLRVTPTVLGVNGYAMTLTQAASGAAPRAMAAARAATSTGCCGASAAARPSHISSRMPSAWLSTTGTPSAWPCSATRSCGRLKVWCVSTRWPGSSGAGSSTMPSAWQMPTVILKAVLAAGTPQ